MENVNVSLDVNEIIAELDELGRAKWQAAHAQAINKKLLTRLTAAEDQVRELQAQLDTSAVS
jgi:ABC-type hemin transport system substrate-binding protein